MKDEKAILHNGLNILRDSHVRRIRELEGDPNTSVNLLEKEAHKVFLHKIEDCKKLIDDIPEVAETQYIGHDKHHGCYNIISVFSTKGEWIVEDYDGNKIKGIKFCPFCGKKLEI